MSFQQQKEDRIHKLIALCIKNNVTPHKPAFCDFINHMCAAIFQFDRRSSKPYVDILISAWHVDRWQTNVKDNWFLSQEEKDIWTTGHSQKY